MNPKSPNVFLCNRTTRCLLSCQFCYFSAERFLSLTAARYLCSFALGSPGISPLLGIMVTSSFIVTLLNCNILFCSCFLTSSVLELSVRCSILCLHLFLYTIELLRNPVALSRDSASVADLGTDKMSAVRSIKSHQWLTLPCPIQDSCLAKRNQLLKRLFPEYSQCTSY